jgi:pantoate--beta-alanine ligase
MNTVTSVLSVRDAVAQARKRGQIVGLVPTMGALHAGHTSLIQRARQDAGFVVVSIFVNPIQFGPHEDFGSYPRPLEADLQVCAREGVDLVFAPSTEAMYPTGFQTAVEVRGLQDVLCGRVRPGHFRGVATVVLKLFSIVQPDVAYFGQKDAQQVRIIEQMVRDLDIPVKICVCPIVREPDGLALSSRNQYLTPEQRIQAVVLCQALQRARELIEAGERDPAVVEREMSELISRKADARLDYATAVSADSLRPLERLHGDVLLAVAVRFGNTRLIDNHRLQIP